MKIIGIVAQKGGSGKTTLALSLAVASLRAGKSTAVIDLDPQATATKWADRRTDKELVVTSAQAARLPQLLEQARGAGADLVIIDTPPRVEAAALTAAKLADLILIPCQPSINDLETIGSTMELLRFAGNAQAIVVLNGTSSRGDRTAQAEAAIRDMAVAVVPMSLGYRAAYKDSAALGLTAQEYEPGGKAAEELKALYRHIDKLVNRITKQPFNQTTEGAVHGEAKLAASA
jgi:chromosome partitioning protein